MGEFERQGREAWEATKFAVLAGVFFAVVIGLPYWFLNRLFPGVPEKVVAGILAFVLVAYWGYKLLYYLAAMVWVLIAPMVRWLKKRGVPK